MNYVILTLILCVIFGLDGYWPLVAIVFAAFFIFLMRGGAA